MRAQSAAAARAGVETPCEPVGSVCGPVASFRALRQAVRTLAARRLPVIQTPPTEEAQALERSPSQWLVIGTAFILIAFLPLSLLGLWAGGSLARKFATSQEAALLMAASPVLLAYGLSTLGAGAAIGRFGLRARPFTAPAAGALAGALLVGFSTWKGAGPWPLLLAATFVFVGGGALWTALGARLGRKRRP